MLLGRGEASPLPEGFLFEGRRYRGSFSVLPDGRVVNLVDLEEYLAGVVPAEMEPSWPAAALQAQAICSRGYVLVRSEPNRPYDLVPSELDQVYRGVASERPASTAAVRATSGQVLRFGNGFAQIAYSSCCGGYTESSAAAWGGTRLPYLEARLCPYCTASPHYRWRSALDAQRLIEVTGRIAPLVGSLRGVSFIEPDRSGRSREVELSGSTGSSTFPAAHFRIVFGARRIPSLLIRRQAALPPLSSSQAFTGLSIEGRGLGHGVGLCQWGARGYALEGGSAAEILGFYFVGTSIGRV